MNEIHQNEHHHTRCRRDGVIHERHTGVRSNTQAVTLQCTILETHDVTSFMNDIQVCAVTRMLGPKVTEHPKMSADILGR